MHAHCPWLGLSPGVPYSLRLVELIHNSRSDLLKIFISYNAESYSIKDVPEIYEQLDMVIGTLLLVYWSNGRLDEFW